MEYLIGLVLALAVSGSAALIGFDRERAFYPVVLMVIASYYVLFSLMGGSGRALVFELVVAGGFMSVAVLGFKVNLWFVVAALIGHGLFDFVHDLLSWSSIRTDSTHIAAKVVHDHLGSFFRHE